MQAFERSIIRVYNGNPSEQGKFAGTAFFIKPQLLITAAHVVQNCSEGIYLHAMSDGSSLHLPADSIEYCETAHGIRDIAFLHTGLSYPIYPIPLATTPPQNKDSITIAGFIDEQQSLHSRETHIAGYVGTQHSWQIADGVKEGMSGGPVTRNGELVGIIQAVDAETHIISYCIPIDEILECLGEKATPLKQDAIEPIEQQRVRDVFVGREQELQQLATALLNTTQTPIAITALHGMAGVGKSWLVDHFYASYKAQFPGGYERITLNAESPESAELLLLSLAEKRGLSFPAESVAHHLAANLQQPLTLIHIENIDSDAALLSATQFCAKLPNCRIALSGRLQNFGKSRHWQQIKLKTFEPDNAYQQLKKELEWLNQSPPTATEAEPLLKRLAGLPLAIHLAAGYLAAGYSINEFIEELHETGFDLPPEDIADASYTRDQIRSVIHSTFRLSLRLLNKQAGKTLPEADKYFHQLGFAPLSGFGFVMV